MRAVRVDKSLEFLTATGRELSFFLSQMVEFLAQQSEKLYLSFIFLASDNKLCNRGKGDRRKQHILRMSFHGDQYLQDRSCLLVYGKPLHDHGRCAE